MSYTVKNENFVVKLSTSRILQFFDIFMRIYRFSEILHQFKNCTNLRIVKYLHSDTITLTQVSPKQNLIPIPLALTLPHPCTLPQHNLPLIPPNFSPSRSPQIHTGFATLSLRMEAYRAHSTLLSFLSRSQLLSGTQSSLCIRPARARRRRIDLPGGRARELQASVGDPCAHQPASLEPFCSI